MPFQPSQLDAITAAADALTTARTQHDAARAQLQSAHATLDQALEAIAPALAEGDIRCLSGPVTAVTRSGGVVRYVVIPGFLDPEPAPAP